MEKVLGRGGVFLRARDPKALGAWGGAILPLTTPHDPGGVCAVGSAFPADTDSFGRRENACMANFRVRDLAAMLAQLRGAGCDVDPESQDGAWGKFGWVTDPEGNRVELWQPPDHPPPDATT